MGAVLQFVDRLTNALSGRGTTIDRSVYSAYSFQLVSPQQAEAAYRTSWLMRKVIDIPPFDMTREWRDWQTDAKNIEAIEAEERRLQLKVKCQRAMILARLFGGGALFLGTDDIDPSQPLQPNRISKGGLKYLHVLSRWQLSEDGQRRLDPADPWFGMPEYFTITQVGAKSQIKIHPSRIVAFVGQRQPEGSFLNSLSWFWGDPIMQSIEQAIKNADLAQDGFAGLIDEAKMDILKSPGLTDIIATAGGEEKVRNRVAAAQAGKSSFRTLMLDGAEEWEQRQVTWAGMPDMLNAYLNVVAGAADIPMTRLLGVSPKGLRSSGEGEERDYHSMVKARQEELLTPALDRVDELLIPSALGSKPSDIYWSFGALSTMSESDAAAVEKQKADTIQVYATTGLIPDVALSAIAKNAIVESGQWPGSETAFEQAANEPLPKEQQNPDDLKTLQQRVAKMESQGSITPNDAALLLGDAAPRSLYVSRKLLNADALIKWAKGQGLETTVPADQMHVTIVYSRDPVDWMAMGNDWGSDDQGRIRIPPGGPRVLDLFGSMKDALVLQFSSSALCWRHEAMIQAGASSDYPDYAPHVTISYAVPDGFDLASIEPYQGELLFGPEIFAEVKEDWKATIAEE